MKIVAIGGGGFSMEPENPKLDDFILSLSGKRRPKVCFVPTASGDAEGYVHDFHAAFPPRRARASHLTLFHDCGIEDPRSHVLDQDVIYVGGGSTANLLAVWRVHGLDAVMREAWQAGVVLAGLSAGMICWFESGATDSLGPKVEPLHGALGLLPGSACPHYDGEEERQPAYRKLVREGRLPPGVAADDSAAIVYEGREIAEVVASRPGAGACRVERIGTRSRETPLPVRYL
jgi:peptidase E